MMNAWISIRDDFDVNDEDNQAFLRQAHDWSAVGTLYSRERGQGRNWQLWSVYFDTEAEFDQAYDKLRSDNPGRTKELAAWDNAGTKIREPHYPRLGRYMPDDPDGTPNSTLRDVNLLAGQTPRDFS